eukprot:COSAG05_NODE_3900_length_1781_cov_1.519025_2_plen_71_part_00
MVSIGGHNVWVGAEEIELLEKDEATGRPFTAAVTQDTGEQLTDSPSPPPAGVTVPDYVRQRRGQLSRLIT